MAMLLFYYKTVDATMEDVGSVQRARTKFLNNMYVYYSVRKPGFVYQLSYYREKIHRCVG